MLLEQVLAPAVVALALPMYLAAGLQQRWHAALLPATPAWQLAAAAVLHVLTVLLACWAMTTNKFFSSVVSFTRRVSIGEMYLAVQPHDALLQLLQLLKQGVKDLRQTAQHVAHQPPCH